MDEDLLSALGERQRAAEPSSARDGEVATEDVPPELAELLAPIEGEEADDLLDGVFSRLSESEEGESEQEAKPVSTTAETAAANWKGAVAVVVAMAAALVLWFGLSSRGGEALPEYSVVSLQGGPAAMRSDDGSPAVSRVVSTPPNGPIRWRLAPEGSVSGPVAVALWAHNDAGEQKLERLERVKISPAGAVEIAGPLDRFIALSPGVWTVEVLIAPKDALPSSTQEASSAGSDAGWQSVPLEVTITAP